MMSGGAGTTSLPVRDGRRTKPTSSYRRRVQKFLKKRFHGATDDETRSLITKEDKNQKKSKRTVKEPKVAAGQESQVDQDKNKDNKKRKPLMKRIGKMALTTW